jgi:Flp pilus assembly protein TadG
MTASSSFRRLLGDQTATAAAELILLLPLATFMLFATVEAGHFMYAQHEVLKSVRDAARWASRQPLSAFDCTAATGDTPVTSADPNLGGIRDDISTLARYGELSTAAPLVVAGWQDNQVSVSYSCVTKDTGIYSSDGYAPVVTVIGTPNYPTLFGSMAAFPSSMKLYARQQAAVVGI